MKRLALAVLVALGLSVAPAGAQSPLINCAYSLQKATKNKAVVVVTVNNHSDFWERIKVKAEVFKGSKKLGSDKISVDVPGGESADVQLTVSTDGKAKSVDVDCS